jgi:glutathione S-transferase
MKDVKVKDGDLQGFNNILTGLAETYPDCKRYAGDSAGQRALVRQWLQYTMSNVRGHSPGGDVADGVLRELDENLASRTFLGGHRMTLVDPLLYVSLYPTYVSDKNES